MGVEKVASLGRYPNFLGTKLHTFDFYLSPNCFHNIKNFLGRRFIQYTCCLKRCFVPIRTNLLLLGDLRSEEAQLTSSEKNEKTVRHNL